MESNNVDYRIIFAALPGNSLLLLPDDPKFTIIAVTNGFVETIGRSRESLLNTGLFESFPNAQSGPQKRSESITRSSIEYTIQHKAPHTIPSQRYDIINNEGDLEEHYWSSTNQPVLDDNGELRYIIHTTANVTAPVMAERRELKIQGIEKAYNLFMHSPVIIGILAGNDYVIQLANEGLLHVWGRKADVIGKPLLEAIPEFEGQGITTLLDKVRDTGEPFYAYDFPIAFQRDGKEEVRYFDFVYKAIYEDASANRASGIISVGHDVTEKVLARQMVQEAEAKYRSLFDSLDQGFCVLRMIYDEQKRPVDYIFLETNPLFESHTGLKDAVGKTAYELVPNLEPYWVELYGGVAANGKAIRFTQGSDALQRWFEVYAFPFGDDGQLVALLFTDISERKNAEQKIRESEERFRKLADDSPIFVFLIDPDEKATVSYWNKAWLEFTGLTLEQALGTEWREKIHPDDIEVVEEIFAEAISSKKPYWIPAARVKHYDGTYRWHSFKGNPRYSAANEFAGYVGVGLDIHDQKLNEEALKQSEKNLRNVILQAPVAMGILRGPNFVIEIANDRMFELWGRKKEELLNKPIFEALPEVRDQGYEQLLSGVYNTGEPVSAFGVPVRLPRDGGVETVYINLLYEAFREADGSVSGIMAVATDVTDQVQARQKIEEVVAERTQELHAANQALSRTNQELGRSNENLEQFAYAASHDLKEPMRKIQIFTDRLKYRLKEKLVEEDYYLLDRIMTASERMRTLIDDLLMYSHFSAGVEAKEPIQLNQLLSLVLSDLDIEIDEKKATVEVNELPTIQGNGRQLQQLFQNLIGNALKYMTPGVAPVINILRKENVEIDGRAYIVIDVKDNGIGFDTKDAERIFNVFTRLHGNELYKGTGVGLAIARKVAENHGGTITASSVPGEGSSFRILLPVE